MQLVDSDGAGGRAGRRGGSPRWDGRSGGCSGSTHGRRRSASHRGVARAWPETRPSAPPCLRRIMCCASIGRSRPTAPLCRQPESASQAPPLERSRRRVCVGGLMQIRDQRAERTAEMGGGHAVEEGADATGEQRIASERCFGVRPALVGRGRPQSRVSRLYSRLVQVRPQHDKHAVTCVNATLLCRAEPSRSAASERAAHSGGLVSQLRRCFRSILSGGREKGRERAATQVQIAAR